MDSEPSTLKPHQTAQRMVEYAVQKHRDRYESCFWKAFAAGVMLSFGNLLSSIVSGGATSLNESNPGLVKLLGGAVFPVGLIMITLQNQELLTSNMLYFPMAVLTRSVPLWGLCINWLIVFFGNLTGSLFFAAILVRYSGIVSGPPYHDYIQAFAIHKAADPQWHQIFLRGIGCNWLVCVAVWQGTAAKDTLSKIVAVWFPIMIFVACSYDHVIANMYSVPLGIMFGADLTPAQYIRKSLLASFFGNIVGALFVALPATYMYLSDLGAGGYGKAENGEAGLNGCVSETRSDEPAKML